MKNSSRQLLINSAGLIILFLLSIGIRLLAWYFEPVIARDGVFYLELVQHWPDIRVPPIFPSLVWRLTQCGFDAHYAALGLNIFCGAMLPVIFYFILTGLGFARYIAWCGACLVMLHPQLVKTSYMILRDSLYLMFFMGFWLALLYAFRKKGNSYFWGGLCCVLACFTRYEALELFVFFLIASIISAIYYQKNYSTFFKTFGWFMAGNICGILLSIMIIDASLKDYHHFWKQIMVRFVL